MFKQDGENIIAPKRDSLDDFRLTLPDGGTMYYDNVGGNWIFSPIDNVIIGQGGGSDKSPDNLYDVSKLHEVALDDHKHTVPVGSHDHMTPMGPSAPNTSQFNTNSDPDSTSRSLEVEGY